MVRYKIHNDDCNKSLNGIGLADALITDPPYGISIYDENWDKSMPEVETWKLTFDKLKPGAYGLVFSSIRLLHHMSMRLENAGFIIKDILMWGYLNGMPKARNIGLDIDKTLNIESDIIGYYNYEQGYKKDKNSSYTLKDKKPIKTPKSDIGKKYDGFGLSLKPAYEPIILIQKPIENGLTVAENIIKYGVGALNLEDTRIPFDENEKKVGHNPHPKGRVMSNILFVESLNDEYDKFFLIPKVRQNKDDFNNHPTIKPIDLINQLVKLTTLENQLVLDPFMGSGTTGVSSISLNRNFIGIEINPDYFNIAKQRLENL
jgi:site-specific DNA-methyltransferase (adenine-specific)